MTYPDNQEIPSAESARKSYKVAKEAMHAIYRLQDEVFGCTGHAGKIRSDSLSELVRHF